MKIKMKKKGGKKTCRTYILNRCGRGNSGCEVTILPLGITKERQEEIQDI